MAISDVDTRAVVRYIRDKGAMNALISTETDIDALKEEIKSSSRYEWVRVSF